MLVSAIVITALRIASPTDTDLSTVSPTVALPAGTANATNTALLAAWPIEPLPDGVSSSDVVSAIVRLGLDADAVAAAGLSTNDAASLVTAAAQALVELKPAIHEADAGAMAAIAAAQVLERKVVAGTASEQEIAAWPATRQAMVAAVASRDALLDAFFALLIAPLSAEQKGAATQIRAQAATWRDLSAPYRATTRAEADMLALREALAAERIALKHGEEVPPEVAQLLAAVRAEPAISSAISSWNSNAATIKATWAAQSTLPPTP